jgi:hypothetical protein
VADVEALLAQVSKANGVNASAVKQSIISPIANKIICRRLSLSQAWRNAIIMPGSLIQAVSMTCIIMRNGVMKRRHSDKVAQRLRGDNRVYFVAAHVGENGLPRTAGGR